MQNVKLIRNGGSQAVRIPARYRLKGKEALIKKIPGGIALYELGNVWAAFQSGLDQFSGRILEDGRDLKDKP